MAGLASRPPAHHARNIDGVRRREDDEIRVCAARSGLAMRCHGARVVQVIERVRRPISSLAGPPASAPRSGGNCVLTVLRLLRCDDRTDAVRCDREMPLFLCSCSSLTPSRPHAPSTESSVRKKILRVRLLLWAARARQKHITSVPTVVLTTLPWCYLYSPQCNQSHD